MLEHISRKGLESLESQLLKLRSSTDRLNSSPVTTGAILSYVARYGRLIDSARETMIDLLKIATEQQGLR